MAGKYPFQSLKLSITALCEYALESRGRWTLVGHVPATPTSFRPSWTEWYLSFTDVGAQPPPTTSTALYEPVHDFLGPLFDQIAPL